MAGEAHKKEHLHGFACPPRAPFVRQFQSLGAWLKLPRMLFFTALGTEEFYVLALPFAWCVNRALGIELVTLLLISTSINELFKSFFKLPRLTPGGAEADTCTIAARGLLAAMRRMPLSFGDIWRRIAQPVAVVVRGQSSVVSLLPTSLGPLSGHTLTGWASGCCTGRLPVA